ncbi:MAG: flagellar basal body P-ring formation chaperone FlgA [Planctomycetota bacterium]
MAVLVVGLTGPARGDEITLKGSVRLPPGATVVHLRDIAELTGPHAERHADLVIAPLTDAVEPAEISVGQVRRALDEGGVHWGKVQLSGRRVIVRPPAGKRAGPPLAMAPVSITESTFRVDRAKHPERPDHVLTFTVAAQLADLATLRGAVATTIMQGLGVSPQDLQLSFDDRDAELLDTGQDRFRFEIQPLSSFDSDRIELSVRAWSDGRIQQSRSLTVRPRVKTDLVVPRRDIDRGRTIRQEDLSVETRWLGTSRAGMISALAEAVGRTASRKLRAGEPLGKRHLEREQLIKRGDRVIVRCLVGGVVISLEAEARSDGAEGELVELRKLGERATFFATAIGRGSAVVDLSR